jgi:hypothetical protein
VIAMDKTLRMNASSVIKIARANQAPQEA